MRKSCALVLDFIVKYKMMHDGVSPTYDEIAVGVGISSKSVVRDRVQWLQAAGYLKEPDGTFGQGRVLEVVGGKWSYDRELAGRLRAGNSRSGNADRYHPE